MRALLDTPVSPRLRAVLESFGYRALHAHEAGLGEATDRELLQFARAEGLLLITADLYLPRFLALVTAAGPGLIIFRGGDYSEQEMGELLADVLRANDPLELDRSVCVVDHRQVRITRLPVRSASPGF